ncbi:hypothetical protein BT96DRAFT_1058976 [Gymnopus androsaceus JB14]|uniref:Amidohydrolase-related domain-containing protein n=1 Tax=Gymnopus androsaceus JB14 TaxID=1447944 RepID=A0A6A4H2G7_9AGAR|nr:hypothetical protein BT96DRAFT_1058976 [Gymnopus androsaceus JB14]
MTQASIQTILHNAAADGIDLSALNFTELVLNEIVGIYESAVCSNVSDTGSGNGSRIDVHNHLVPAWYQSLVPLTGGNPTPEWNLTSALSFMDSEDIGHSVLSFSSPGAAVFPGNQSMTDLVLISSFEGKYLGNPEFTEFFKVVNEREGKQIIFVHPGTPFLVIDGQLVEANPTVYPTGFIEFYFETTRTFQDLTVTQTLANFTNIDWILPHAGGAYPAVIDRNLYERFPELANSTYDIMKTRLWYDTASPTFLHQIGGLFAYSVGDSQVMLGSDFPYAPQSSQAGSLQAILDSDFVNGTGKEGIFTGNAEQLFGTHNLVPGCFH